MALFRGELSEAAPSAKMAPAALLTPAARHPAALEPRDGRVAHSIRPGNIGQRLARSLSQPHGRHLVGFGGGFDALGPTDALGCCTCPLAAGTFGPDAPTGWPMPRNERPFTTEPSVGRPNCVSDWEAIWLTKPIRRNPAGCAGQLTIGSWTSSLRPTGFRMRGLSSWPS